MKMTREIAEKVLRTVDAGLVSGIGKPVPGQMCVEAAVCFALGLPHSDNPPCVSKAVRAFKIRLNDSAWSSDAARTEGLRALAVAQLGSDVIDGREFAKMVAEQVIRQILPIALRAASSVQKKKEHRDALELAAKNCESEGTHAAALEAKSAADAAAYAANADAYAAANAAAYAAANAAADAAAYAANADAYAANAAAYAAAYAAYAADAADAAVKRAQIKDDILILMAKIGVEILQKLGSPGCQWLDLVR